MVMMYYIVAFLCRSSTLQNMRGGDAVQQMLSLGVGVIGVLFGDFSVLYKFFPDPQAAEGVWILFMLLGIGETESGKDYDL